VPTYYEQIFKEVRFLVAPPAKLRNALLSGVSEFFVLADCAELPIKLPIRQSSEAV